MRIGTRVFGEIDLEEEKIIQMPLGLPGFPGKNRFVLLERVETRPFCWYQSVDDPNLALVVMNPRLFLPEYEVDLKAVCEAMAWEGDAPEEMAVYVVLTINDEGPHRVTANLIGPIIINTEKHEAVQRVMTDSPYSHQYPIMNPAEGEASPGAAAPSSL